MESAVDGHTPGDVALRRSHPQGRLLVLVLAQEKTMRRRAPAVIIPARLLRSSAASPEPAATGRWCHLRESTPPATHTVCTSSPAPDAYAICTSAASAGRRP
ncbi:hypothetical protein U9M48_004614 [Paspalum notatum var. saurae]|uniref:Uncharacterized protein n=1 Tax=Paspalum notatum var. saurae TaxID=547442 RepID=A0AAQ3PQE0_PASNO